MWVFGEERILVEEIDMKDVTIISAEEKEILLKNTTIIKNMVSRMKNYLNNHMTEKDMGIGKINPEDFLYQVDNLEITIDEILEIL